jgi:hypothetical protein
MCSSTNHPVLPYEVDLYHRLPRQSKFPQQTQSVCISEGQNTHDMRWLTLPARGCTPCWHDPPARGPLGSDCVCLRRQEEGGPPEPPPKTSRASPTSPHRGVLERAGRTAPHLPPPGSAAEGEASKSEHATFGKCCVLLFRRNYTTEYIHKET